MRVWKETVKEREKGVEAEAMVSSVGLSSWKHLGNGWSGRLRGQYQYTHFNPLQDKSWRTTHADLRLFLFFLTFVREVGAIWQPVP